FSQCFTTTIKPNKHLKSIILFHVNNFRIPNKLFYKNLVIQLMKNVSCILFAICWNINDSFFNRTFSCSVILKFLTKNVFYLKLGWTQFSNLITKLNIEFLTVILVFVN